MGKMSAALYIEGAYLTLNDLVDAAPFSMDDFISADVEALTFFRRHQEDSILAQWGSQWVLHLPQGLSR